jgi:hypothetical protein
MPFRAHGLGFMGVAGVAIALAFAPTAAAAAPWLAFRIDCVDEETGRGVPLVQLKTSSYIAWISDSAGVIAFDEPGLLGLDVYFVVLTDGYSVVTTLPNEPHSEPGVLLRTEAGGRANITLRRLQPAERLFRLTGGGLYRDSILVGAEAPIVQPLLSSAGVLGQDSLMAAPYKGQVFWFFGDTECPAGPRDTDCQHYARFTTGATSPLSEARGARPPSLVYFASEAKHDPGGMAADGRPSAALLARWNPRGFAHPRAMLAGPGEPPEFNMSTWIGSLTVLSEHGEERMYTTFVCPNGGPDQLFGLARWDDAAEVFRPVGGAAYRMRYSGAQTVQRLRQGDEEHVYFASAFAMSRVAASFSAIEEPSAYEYFTPCTSAGCGANMSAASWAWRRADLDGQPGGVAYFGPEQEAAAIREGKLAAADSRMQVVDAQTKQPIGGILIRGSVAWNAHRNAYLLIAVRKHEAASDGTSRFGEIYACEASEITGPWRECTNVVTHNVTGSSCYNPMALPWLEEEGGRVVFLACTFTSMTSGTDGASDRACRFDDYGGVDCAVAVPRYEYNNLVFRLDLAKMPPRGASA